MKRFIVAYITFHDNVLHQESIMAATPFAAALRYLQVHDSGEYDEIDSLDALKSLCFDMDSMISVYQI